MPDEETDMEQAESAGEVEETGVQEEPEAAPAQPQPAQVAVSDELKVVINMKGDRLMVGVQSPDCDPVYRVMQGDLVRGLAAVPELVSEARTKWANSRRNPKADLPAPPPPPPMTTTTTTSPRSQSTSRSKSKSEAQDKKQPSFF